MTQFFTYRGFKLAEAPFQIRVLITTFLMMTALAVFVGAVNYQLRTGLSAEGSAAWYRGSRGLGQRETTVGRRSRQGRGDTEAVAEGEATPALYAKTPLELLDATHPHLFNQAFLFFLLGHILALCTLRASLKVGLYLAGFGGILIDTASPWLIRFVHPTFGYVQLVGQLLLAGAFAGFLCIPLWEMWGERARSGHRRVAG